MATCLPDCEFTDLHGPQLVSIGLVRLAAARLYAALDLDTDVGDALALRAAFHAIKGQAVGRIGNG